MATLNFEAVRKLGLSLPDVVDATTYGAPALKLHGRMVACIPANKSAEANSLVVTIDVEHRAELLRQQPDVYYITDHYLNHPTVLVRLAKISRTDLRELLRDACNFAKSSASKRARSRRERPRIPKWRPQKGSDRRAPGQRPGNRLSS